MPMMTPILDFAMAFYSYMWQQQATYNEQWHTIIVFQEEQCRLMRASQDANFSSIK